MATIPGAAKFGRFFGSAASTGAGFAIGVATAPTLDPILQEISNAAWSLHPDKPIDVTTLANGVAQGQIPHDWAVDEAARTGFNKERFDHMVDAADTGPGVGEAFRLWRRDAIDDAAFKRALRREGLETEWITALAKTKNEHLTPAQIALGIVRSLLKDPGFLPTTLDVADGTVPAYPISPLDPVVEAQSAGITSERLRVMVGEIGLPMALQSAASAVFRGIIKRADFNRAVLEGDTRPEWADAILDQAREIPSVADYVNAHIRGWIKKDEMETGAARHGMSATDVNLLYLRTGRPAAPGQMATAAARGIDGPDNRPMDKAQFLKGIAESDIRPEWGEMLWESRFLYPPLFQLTRLVQGNAITPEVAKDWAIKDRYPPEVVDALFTYWKTPAATKADTHEAKAQVQLWTALHSAYLAGDATDSVVTAKLPQAGVAAATVPKVLATWKHEREIVRQRLTATQVKKAYTKRVRNPATGAPWTRDDALAELLSRGWSAQDANTFLDE